MTGTNQEPEEGVIRALREAALLFDPPQHDVFHERAVRRVHQIRRRRAAGMGLAGLVAAGTAGALALFLLSGAPVASMPVHVAAGTSAPHTADASSVTQAQILQVFLDALSVRGLSIPDDQGGAAWADGPDVDQFTGAWYVSTGAMLRGPDTAESSVSVTAMRGAQTPTCTQADVDPGTDECSVRALDGGTLMLDETRPDPEAESSQAIWRYRWRSSAGDEVDLSISAHSASGFALTEQQALDVLTDPGWAQLVARLPAPVCQGGRLTQITATTPASAGNALDLKCSTDGTTYPAT